MSNTVSFEIVAKGAKDQILRIYDFLLTGVEKDKNDPEWLTPQRNLIHGYFGIHDGS